MINRGPVDVLVFALGAPQFDGSILRELQKQTASGTIRVLDVMVLFKSAEGQCWSVDIENLPEEDLAKLKFDKLAAHGLFDSEDAETLWEGMVPDSAVMALAIEHTWAIELVNVLEAAGVEVAVNYRVPAPIVNEAFASLESNA
jgi:hypothetical protein